MSEQNILKIIQPGPAEPNANCIEALEGALERARCGDTVGVLVIEQGSDNAGGWCCGGYVGSYSMLGAIQVAQQTLVADQIDEDY